MLMVGSFFIINRILPDERPQPWPRAVTFCSPISGTIRPAHSKAVEARTFMSQATSDVEVERGERLIRLVSVIGLMLVPVLIVFVHLLLIYSS